MNFVHGMALIGALGLLLLTGGYSVAGFMSGQSRLDRFAVASLAGLAWLILGASLLGAIAPLSGMSLGLFSLPVLAAGLIPATRRQLLADIRAVAPTTRFRAAAAGWGLFLAGLLVPFLVYPDLVFHEGKTNHDYFLWIVSAEYFQSHSYLSAPPVVSPDHPLYATVGSVMGWHPVCGRMGTEGYLAVIGSVLRRSPLAIGNFAACALALPWILTVLAVAQRLGLPRLKPGWLLLVCSCQPILAFFIANGNLPNLLGAIFGGGLWLLALLAFEPGPRPGWPLLLAGALCTHGMLCCYPEIAPFALLPVGLLTAWHLGGKGAVPAAAGRAVVAMILAGLCLNPLTSVRAWAGFWSSLDSARFDTRWVNVFAKLNAAEYIPGLVTLSAPGVQLYGWFGGFLASLAVVAGAGLLWRQNRRPGLLLVSLAGFGTLLLYTVLTSFAYGWQKSVQFSGIQIAALFPVLLAGLAQESFHAPAARRVTQALLVGTLGLLVHGAISQVEDNLKWAGRKGLTGGLLTLHEQAGREYPGLAVYCDSATFHFPFFHSMWSAWLFADAPLHYLPGPDQPGGYLRTAVNPADPGPAEQAPLYYVATDWARAFDYQPVPAAADRVGILLRKHNRVTATSGFYRTSGVPTAAGSSFALAIEPYADGWLEITLRPNGAVVPGSRLRGSASAGGQTENLEIPLEPDRKVTVRFPLKAGVPNQLVARIEGVPAAAVTAIDPPYPFEVLDLRATAAGGP